MTAELYITALSPFGARLRLVSQFTGHALPEKPPPGGAGSAEMKAINPFGKMPAIALDDRVLIESLALMEYLVETAPKPVLMPQSAADRASMRGIMLAHDSYVLGAVWPMFLQLRTGKPDPAIVVPALRACTEQYTVLIRLFDETSDFAVGGVLSLADLTMVPFAVLFHQIYPLFGEKTPFSTIPRLARWWHSVGAIPEIERVTSALAATVTRVFGPK